MDIKCTQSPFGAEKDLLFMQEALKEARTAFDHQEVPIGAIVVAANGAIIGRGANTVERNHTQSAHAESLAINQAGAHLNDWRLNDCWIYVTLEPCLMCMNLIYLSRLTGVIFGAASPLFGYRLDNLQADQVYKKAMVLVKEGVCADESAQLLKQFFNQRRNE